MMAATWSLSFVGPRLPVLMIHVVLPCLRPSSHAAHDGISCIVQSVGWPGKGTRTSMEWLADLQLHTAHSGNAHHR